MLNERRATILKHTVTDYVRTNVPVGSERLMDRLGLSSASIRNELHALTDMGYLEQPHVSAGRVPTDTGYRFFVDHLLGEITLAEAEEDGVRRGMELIQFKLDQMFRDMMELLASWTQCIGFVSVPQASSSVLSRIELTEVSPRVLLLLVVLSNGMVETKLVELPVDVRRLPLDTISQTLNRRLAGRGLRDIKGRFLDAVFAEVQLFEEAVRETVKQFLEGVMFTLENRLYVDGARQIMNQPEFQDARRLRPVLEVLQREHLSPGLLDAPLDGSVAVSIGRENTIEELRACSVLKRHFSFGDRTLGTLGVIGPTRMDYSRLIGLVRHIADAMTHALRHMPAS